MLHPKNRKRTVIAALFCGVISISIAPLRAETKYDAIVAADGSGCFTNRQSAIQLADEEAKGYTVANILSCTDGWKPMD
jgi:hypothetical protein